MGIYDDISNILRTNPLTSISYAAGANVGKVVQNIPKINLPSTVSSLMPVVSAMAIPLAPAISGVKLAQSIPKINLPSTTMSLKPLVSAAPMLAIHTPVISSARVVQNIPNVTSSLSRGYESANTALSGVTKQVFPSYQETGYMFNKLVADPLYGQLVKQRTGLLPSENWIATTSPGAMTTGGYTVVQKNADGTETRTKYGFKTDGSIASNVMRGITGFAEGGWNMPRERPLDTALILATGGVGEIAAGTSLGAKVLASPAARYGLIAGVGFYGGDVASRVAGVGDATADKSIYGMAKRLGGITTTEIAPGTVVFSPIVKSIAVKTPIVKNYLVSQSRKAHTAANIARSTQPISISRSDMTILRKMRPGEPEYMSAHSPTKDVGFVRGGSNHILEEFQITHKGVGDGEGGVFPGTSFFDEPDMSKITFLHTHPIFEYTHSVTPEVGTVLSDPIPSGNDILIHLIPNTPSKNAAGARLDSETGYIVTMHGVQTPFEYQAGSSRFVDIPRATSAINKFLGVVNIISPKTTEKMTTPGSIAHRLFRSSENIENKIIENLNQDLFEDAIRERKSRDFAVKTYESADALYQRDAMGDKPPYGMSSLDFVNALNTYSQKNIRNLKDTLARFGGVVTTHKVNLKTGEQQLVNYPIIARSVPVKGVVEKLTGVKNIPGYYLPAPTPITPVVYNKPATSVSEVKQLIESKMPTLKDGYTRLYRVDPVSQSATGSSKPPSWLSEHSDTYAGRWFSDDLGNALWYWNQRASGDLDIPKLSYVDVPTKDVSAYKVSNIPKSKVEDASMFMDNPAAFSLNPTQEFYIPKLLAQQKEPVLTATKRLDNIGLIFPEGNYPGPRKQRYNQKKKLVKTGKKSKTTKKRLIPQKKKPHLIVPKKKQQRSKQRTSLSTGTKIEKQMSKNVNRFLGW